jgi:hypothetical protein
MLRFYGLWHRAVLYVEERTACISMTEEHSMKLVVMWNIYTKAVTAGFEVVMVVAMNSSVFWDEEPDTSTFRLETGAASFLKIGSYLPNCTTPHSTRRQC